MGKAKRKQMSRKKKLIIWAIVLAAVAALCFWAFYSGLVVRKYEISTDKIAENDSVRIVVIADLHSHIYGDAQQPLIDMIKKEKPDIIALVGDIVDDNGDTLGAELLIAGIVNIAPIYFVTGNHEIRSGEIDEIKRFFYNYKVNVLENENDIIMINGISINICGIDDPEILKYTHDEQILAMSEYSELLQKIPRLENSSVNILLAHRPEKINDYAMYDYDIVLSGHTHGGQIRIPPFINGVFAPDQGFFPKYAGGLYWHGDLAHIISRGFMYNPRLPRMFNPPEVVVVDIMGEQP